MEYDEDDEPKRRPILVVAIAVGVILLGAGLGWMLVGNLDEPDGEVERVTKAQKAQEVRLEPDEPDPDPQPEPEPDEVPIVQPVKKPTKKPALTFEQAVAAMKGRIRKKCSSLGPGPVDIDSLVVKDGTSAIAPKIKPRGPVGDCARRIVEATSFPPPDRDRELAEKVSW